MLPHTIRVGFTGTQAGMTQNQKDEFMYWCAELNILRFNHGDCVGSDEEAHDLVRHVADRFGQNAFITVWPGPNDKKRAFKSGDLIMPRMPHLERNEKIVDSSKVLIATPRLNKEEVRSGTWHTIRYARKNKKPVIIIWPDGNTTEERP